MPWRQEENTIEVHYSRSIRNRASHGTKQEGGAFANPFVQPWQVANTSFPCYFKSIRALVNGT